MMVQCPHCLAYRTQPEPLHWYAWPLLLLLIQPYQCRRCGHHFLRPRWPDLPSALHSGRQLIAR